MEPVFGQIKFNLGFKRFHLRRLDKAHVELALACLTHDIKKIHVRHMVKGCELDDLTGNDSQHIILLS